MKRTIKLAAARDEAPRVLFGPAGLAVHGPDAETQERNGASLRLARVELRQTVRHVLSRPQVRQLTDAGERRAAAFCRSARIGPEHCAGLARVPELRSLHGGDEQTANPVCTLVRGIVAVHPRTHTDAYERMRAAAPLELHAPAGIHVEV